MIGVPYICPNVYVSSDMYLTMEEMPGAEKDVHAANLFLEYKLLFGTAYLLRSLRQSVQQFHRLPFKDEKVMEKVLTHYAKNSASKVAFSFWRP
ncbi:MAG TPA: hypothetical protein DDZ83_08780 [Nitrospinae bacterium]|nr:hypothetical protein [Nitrospinota bacterium]